MILKENFSCLDAGLCNFENEECYLAVWSSRLNGDKVVTLHRKSDREEIYSHKIGERQFVSHSHFNIISQSLKVLEVREQTNQLPDTTFVISVFDIVSKNTISTSYSPQSRNEQFLSSAHKDGNLVLAFMYYNDEACELPVGITLLEYDSSLNLLGRKFHPFNSSSPQIINYFCSTSTVNELCLLLEDEESDCWLYTFSLDTLTLIKTRKLVPATEGFGYIRVAAIKENSLFLISANWTLFEIDLGSSSELDRTRLNISGDKIPSVLFWDDYKWLTGRNDGKIWKIISNAEDFILSIKD